MIRGLTLFIGESGDLTGNGLCCIHISNCQTTFFEHALDNLKFSTAKKTGSPWLIVLYFLERKLEDITRQTSLPYVEMI